SPGSTSCTGSRSACSPGATISATRATGPCSSATSSPRAAPTRCGRWWRHGETMSLRFDPIRLPEECETLRRAVRAFLAEEIAAGPFDPSRPEHGDAHDDAFSRRVGAKGWIGMTWPKRYGGHERSFLERFVVTEEFRVANAPVRRHFVADRQS